MSMCPVCGGSRRVPIASGYWECANVVVAGFQGSIPIERICGNRYQDGSGLPADPCDCGQPCGTYSIGRCVTCARPTCGDHSRMTEQGRLCGACLADARDRHERREHELDEEHRREFDGWVTSVRESARQAASALLRRDHPGVPVAEVSMEQRPRLFEPGRYKTKYHVRRELGRGWFVLSLRGGAFGVLLLQDGSLHLYTSRPLLARVDQGWGNTTTRLQLPDSRPFDLERCFSPRAFRLSEDYPHHVLRMQLLAALQHVGAGGDPPELRVWARA